MYTDIGSDVYGCGVRCVRMFMDVGSDMAVQVDSINTRVESVHGVCNQRLKLTCDESLSNFAFNFNLRGAG